MTKTTGIPSFEERVSAVEQLGYTRREAEFVVLAALHSGYFLRRQFSEPGKVNTGFCRKLLFRNHGKLVHSAGHAQVYHISAKPLFRTLGQDDNRHRRNHESFYIRSKIMLLDYVLATHQGPQFLATEEDKVEYFCTSRGLNRSVLPSRKYVGHGGAKTTRYFVDKFPVRVDKSSGIVSFGYVDDGISKAGFRTWLTQIQPLIEALGSAEIVFVSSSVGAIAPAKKEFARRFRAGTGPLETYFRMRLEIEEKRLVRATQEALDRYRNWRRQYADAPYEGQYAAWKQSGGLLELPAAGVKLSTHLLPFRYQMFGEIGAGEESNVGLRDDSEEIEGGCVCFVASADEKFIRIGFSSRVIRRRSDIRRLHAGDLGRSGQVKLLGYMPGSEATEGWLHEKFSADHHTQKWFRASEDLRAFIAGVGLLKMRMEAANGGRTSGFSGAEAQ